MVVIPKWWTRSRRSTHGSRSSGLRSGPNVLAFASASETTSCDEPEPKSGSNEPPSTSTSPRGKGAFPVGNAAGWPYHVGVLVRRTESQDPLVQERQALIDQRA